MMTVDRAREIREMVDRYRISLEHGKDGKHTGRIQASNVRAVNADKAGARIGEAKADIIEYISQMFRPDIEGLEEITAAMDDVARWHDAFRRSFEGEYAVGGMGVGKRPDHDIKAMRAKYPRANAYLEAQALSNKTNVELSSIGQDALLEVVFGDYKKAMEDMEQRRKDFVDRHIWD